MEASNVRKFITVITPNCPRCSHPDKIVVDETSYDAWLDGAFIQDAFPTMCVARAEQLVSGYHPECWDVVVGGPQ